jgi:hypothetical protein
VAHLPCDLSQGAEYCDPSTVFAPRALEEALVGDSPADRTYYMPVQC